MQGVDANSQNRESLGTFEEMWEYIPPCHMAGLGNTGDSPVKTYLYSFLHSKQKLFSPKNFLTEKFYHLIPMVCALVVYRAQKNN